MHYVRFAGSIEQERGSFLSITRRDMGSGAVGIVDNLRPDLEEIDEDTYNTELAEIRQYNIDHPQPQPVPPERPEKVARDALRSATTVAQIKSALDDYFAARGG